MAVNIQHGQAHGDLVRGIWQEAFSKVGELKPEEMTRRLFQTLIGAAGAG